METIDIGPPAEICFNFKGCGDLMGDPYILHEEITELRGTVSEDNFLDTLQGYIAARTVPGAGDTSDAPDMSQCLMFNDAIIGIVERLNEERKKKVESIVSLPVFSLGSPEITEDGANDSNSTGSKIIDMPKQGGCSSTEDSTT